MAKISDFNEDVQAEIVGVPSPFASRIAKQVVREFCHETEVWQYDTRGSVIKSVNEISLDIPNGSTYVTIHGVKVNDKPLGRRSREQLDMKVPDWNVKPGVPKFYFEYQQGLYLAPIPDKTKVHDLYIELSLKPKRDSDEIADDIMDAYYEPMLNGILGRIQGIRHRPWFDRASSDQRLSMYYQSMADAKARSRGNDRSRQIFTSYGGY